MTAQNASAGFRPGASESDILAPEESKQVADRDIPVGRLRHRTLRLHTVAVPAAALLLDDVPGDGEVADDTECTALGDADGRGISRSRTPGSRAMHSSTRAWLVRKPQVGMRGKYHIFPEYRC